jgi:large subunit ribosomal protein L21
LVQSLAVPKPDGSLSAVVVSGGKQYRVAPGDQILVDRIDAEPGSSLTLGRVLLLSSGGEVKVGTPTIAGLEVETRVIAHRRGPRLESLRYKSKKRVRVHHGGRADLTALAIVAIGGVAAEPTKESRAETKPRPARAKAEARTAAKVESKTKAEPVAVEAPAKRAPRKPKKETE